MAWEKTWGGLKGEILRLGFTSADELDENLPTIIDAVNRSMKIINNVVPAISEKQYIKTTDGIERIVLDGAVDHVTEELDTTVIPYSNYMRELGNSIILFEPGTFNVFYQTPLTAITASTGDSFVLQNDERVIELVPLLASYFVWIDDDASKAITYYNQFSEQLNIVNNKINATAGTIRGTIVGGF